MILKARYQKHWWGVLIGVVDEKDELVDEFPYLFTPLISAADLQAKATELVAYHTARRQFLNEFVLPTTTQGK